MLALKIFVPLTLFVVLPTRGTCFRRELGNGWLRHNVKHGGEQGIHEDYQARPNRERVKQPPGILLVFGIVFPGTMLTIWLIWAYLTLKSRVDNAEDYATFKQGVFDMTKSSMEVSSVSLCFRAEDEETCFIMSNAPDLCHKLRVLCALIVVQSLCTIPWSWHSHYPEFAKDWLAGSSNTRASTVYQCALVVHVCMTGALFLLSLTERFQQSRSYEKVTMSWLILFFTVRGIFMCRCFVAKIMDETHLIGNLDFNEEGWVISMTMLVLFLCIHTTIRFVLLMPFCMCIPCVCVCLVNMVDSPRAAGTLSALTSNFKQEAHLFIFVVASLWSKFCIEIQQRSTFTQIHQAYKITETLLEETDSQCKRSPVEKASWAMSKAARGLEAISASQAIASAGLTSQLMAIKGCMQFALSAMQHADRLFEVDPVETLRGTVCEQDEACINFLRENMSQGKSSDSHCQPSMHAVYTQEVSERQIRTSSSVNVVGASRLAAGWGKDWDFNALSMSRSTGGFSLIFAGERGLVDETHSGVLSTSHDSKRAWIRAIHARYLPNPYHNEAHAAQVSHLCMWLARQTNWLQKADDLQICALVIAALAHDVGHIGRNNIFCSKTAHAFSLIWNDKSVLENMSAATCFSVMEGDADILESLTAHSRGRLRRAILRFILATDIKDHQLSKAKLRARMANGFFWQRAAVEAESSEQAQEQFMDDVILAGEVILSASDVGHAMLPWKFHKEWSLRIQLEFWEQGDEESSLGLPVSPLCSRDNINLACSQAFFIDCLCGELFLLLLRVAEENHEGHEKLRDCLKLGKENIELWKAEAAKIDSRSLTREHVIDLYGDPQIEAVFPYSFEKSAVCSDAVCTPDNLQQLIRCCHTRWCMPQDTIYSSVSGSTTR